MPIVLAQYLRKKHNIHGVPTDRQIDAMLRGASLILDPDWPFAGRIQAVYVLGHVAIRTGLTNDWRRWVKLHELAHHLLHTGNQIVGWEVNPLRVCQQERAADALAGYILLGELIERYQQDDEAFSVAAVAELADVPAECISHWCEIVGMVGPHSKYGTWG